MADKDIKTDPKTGEKYELVPDGECDNCSGTGDHPENKKDWTGEVMVCPRCKGCGIKNKRVPVNN